MGIISELYLKHHVKAMVKNYYFLTGQNMKDIENKSVTELLEIMNKILEELKKQNEGYTQTISNQEISINKLQEEVKGLKQDKANLQTKNEELFNRNERLTQRLSINSNIKELKQDKVVGIER